MFWEDVPGRIKEALTLVSNSSSLKKEKNVKAFYYSLALRTKEERQEHLSQKEKLVQTHSSVNE